ncbi:hypothetical protein [Georgenia yuyongxinii]
MSRRYTPRTDSETALHWNPDLAEPDPSEHPVPPTLDGWDPAYQHATIDVVDAVWRKQGAKYYAAHKYRWLRDDLVDWLLVQAMELAPKWECHDDADPVKHWRAYLYSTLTKTASWHFNQMVRRTEEARAAVNAGVDSTDRIADAEAETGGHINRRALHGNDPMAADPQRVYVLMEDIARHAEEAERAAREHGIYTTTSDGTCTEPGCTRPVRTALRCSTHAQQHRRLWGNGNTCAIPDCTQGEYSRGVCRTHYDQHRRGKLHPSSPPTSRRRSDRQEMGRPPGHHRPGPMAQPATAAVLPMWAPCTSHRPMAGRARHRTRTRRQR